MSTVSEDSCDAAVKTLFDDEEFGCARSLANKNPIQVLPSTSLTSQPGDLAVSPSPITLKKRGRPKKQCSSSANDDCKWTLAMTETLLRSKFDVFKKYFEDTKRRGQVSEGWIKVTYSINREYGCSKNVEQVKSRYQYLLKKWRDHKPSGKESTRTGNQKPDPSNCKDEEFSIIAEYMARKGGCGTDLGQAIDVQDLPNADESVKGEDVSEVVPAPATPGVRVPARSAKGEAYSELATSLEIGLLGMADGLKAIASSLSTNTNNEVLQHLRVAEKARTEDRETLKDMRSFLETSNQVQLAMLKELQKLSEK
jgi:hypothetical protein